jgi:hypothetical protein
VRSIPRPSRRRQGKTRARHVCSGVQVSRPPPMVGMRCVVDQRPRHALRIGARRRDTQLRVPHRRDGCRVTMPRRTRYNAGGVGWEARPPARWPALRSGRESIPQHPRRPPGDTSGGRASPGQRSQWRNRLAQARSGSQRMVSLWPNGS